VQKIYTPLELAGRDIYISEGCYNCHSQQIRTMVPDVLRYGDPSRLGESIYDHPFQWGSKRTGPDLARVGGKYPNIWHYNHMLNPRSINANSTMPNYAFLFDKKTDVKALPSKIAVQVRLGVPYPPMNEQQILEDARKQAVGIKNDLVKAGASPNVSEESQLIALISYLQKLGQSDQVENPPVVTPLANRPFPITPDVPDRHRTAAVGSPPAPANP
jgi:cytochrome c oxidase cbb3-type subunit I/II